MDKKSFQIIMAEGAHAQLKRRSRHNKVTIGDFIENMLSSLELRLEAAYGMMNEIAVHKRTDSTDSLVIAEIFKADSEGVSHEEFAKRIENLGVDLFIERVESNISGWKPTFKGLTAKDITTTIKKAEELDDLE